MGSSRRAQWSSCAPPPKERKKGKRKVCDAKNKCFMLDMAWK